MDKKKNNLKLYSISYILRSTVWTMPVLPLYWINQANISISVYLTFAAIIPLLSLGLDFPLSLLADKTGLKRSYIIGLSLFGFAFIFPIFFKNIIGYILYLVFATVANGVLSGLSTAFFRELCGQESYRENFSNLTHKFYLYTIPFFFAGVFIYYHSPKILLLVQGGCILVSALIISKIPYQSSNIKKKKNLDKKSSDKINEGWNIKVTPKYVILTTLVLLTMALLNGIVQFQNRTIQILIKQNVDSSSEYYLYIIAVVFAIGNILSAMGLSSGITKFIKKKKSWVITAFLVFLFCVSLILLSSKVIGLIVVGYVLISLGKGIYRPFFNSIFSMLQPNGSWNAKWFSVASIFSGILVAILNTILASYTEDIARIQVIWGGILLVLGIMTIAVLYKLPIIKLLLKTKNGLSNKKKYRVLNIDSGNEVYFEKEGESRTLNEIDIKVFNKKLKDSNLKTPQLMPMSDGKFFNWQFINGNLLEHLDEIQSKKISEKLFLDLNKRKVSAFIDDNLEFINGLANVKALELCSCMCSSHGDLHPGNILIDASNQYKVIDWDFAGMNCKLADEFSIFWHPFFKISTKERITITKKLLNTHSENCTIHNHSIKNIVKELIEAKIKDIESWCVKNEYINELKKGYLELLYQLEDGKHLEGVK